ncbi:hypothetical protein H0H81_004759 [Sphagnurus paluster]|uniref:Oxidoreductase AflY n=1 Tax=Sphagnurus paluster TaxID=117069 RepID=A0A9P7FRW0_9AGAR|nr:hypothetical protein H0H81_004759 [Sphagnurus paluster]
MSQFVRILHDHEVDIVMLRLLRTSTSTIRQRRSALLQRPQSHRTMASDSDSISDLFPVPSSPPSDILPRRWPGISPQSTTALREVLKENHTRWHIFFNDSGFHNHTAHRAIANWALGASGDVIRDGYKKDSATQRPAFEPPEAIHAGNFKDHLGNKRYYGGYLAFFTHVIREHGIAPVLEQYIFSKDMNIDPSSEKSKKPDMFNRFVGGLIHPLIHIGYGLEFCLPGMVAEGLAETAVHLSAHIPHDFFQYEASVEDTLARLHVSPSHHSTSTPPSKGAHAFTILQRVFDDPALGKVKYTGSGMFDRTMADHASAIAQHMGDWHVDGASVRDVERKIEELSWMNALIYGVGGWAEDKPFNADFFHMHLVTSSLFLSAYAAYLKPSSQEHLLRGYLLISLAWWVSRGRPALNIPAFFSSTSTSAPAHPLPTGPLPTPHPSALAGKHAVTPNAWLPIIETAVVHPDDHLPKLQRALAHYNSLYGARGPGELDFKATGLEGAEVLDGTLFVRAAWLTARRMGRVREGEAPGEWDNGGFYKT